MLFGVVVMKWEWSAQEERRWQSQLWWRSFGALYVACCNWWARDRCQSSLTRRAAAAVWKSSDPGGSGWRRLPNTTASSIVANSSSMRAVVSSRWPPSMELCQPVTAVCFCARNLNNSTSVLDYRPAPEQRPISHLSIPHDSDVLVLRQMSWSWSWPWRKVLALSRLLHQSSIDHWSVLSILHF